MATNLGLFILLLRRHRPYDDTLPYDTAAVKIAAENTIELLESASVIGNAIGNVERNSTFSPYSHILS